MDEKVVLPAEIEQAQNFDLAALANFVHQVVNPLNGVAGTLDNIAEGSITDERRKLQRIRAARAQLEQCISLIRNLAYFAQGFHPLAEHDRNVIVLPQVIIESAMFFQEDAEDKGVRIALKDRRTQNRVEGHLGLITQVLMNIFDNCVKYSEPGTEVVVNQRIQKKTSNAIITIANRSRMPIDPQDVPRFFDLGFRGGNARKIIASGTGLGMYIAKKIVEEVHGGHLRVQLSGLRDLEFTISLPRAQGGA